MVGTHHFFRSEVIEAQPGQWLGRVSLAHLPGFEWAAAFACILTIALTVFLINGEITRKSRLHGVVTPRDGLIRVPSPQQGIVKDIAVRDGEVVQPGQVLLRLFNSRQLDDGDAVLLTGEWIKRRREAVTRERSLVLQQASEREDSLREREESLVVLARNLESDLVILKRRLDLASTNQKRFAALAQEGFVSSMQSQSKYEDVLDLNLRERAMERDLQKIKREVEEIHSEVRAGRIATQMRAAQIDSQLAALSQEANENAAREGLLITAPQGGVVSGIVVNSGDSVQTGQTFLNLVAGQPKNANSADHNTVNKQSEVPVSMEVHLYATSRAVGFVGTGQKVLLRYAAFPFQKFGMASGTVVTVGRTPIAPVDLPTGQAQALMSVAKTNEPLYRITVELERQFIRAYGKYEPIRPGMTVDADVIQERRAVWQWILDPLLRIYPPRPG